MNLKTLAIAASIAALLPTMAMSQALDGSISADSNIGDNASTMDFDTFLNGFTSADFTSAFDALGSSNTVSVIKVSGMPNADAAKLDGALSPRESDLVSLRTQVSNSQAAMRALEAVDATADDVIGVDAYADGSVYLYVNDLDTM